ncbi:hypothetical protein [Bradyrhizobium murdochi]|uniref:hypothetical protein n=1 Tax=Bradyrhizobium murdochi TaxID=1038859 RepID=UPI0012ECB696|nr:hypothetical protein [Bradyrhizobium murdochi]
MATAATWRRLMPETPGNQRPFDLPQHRLLDSFQKFPGISLELLENAAFPFASRSSLPYR